MADAVTHDVTGILVPADEPRPLVDALRTLEANPLLRTRLGQAGCEAARSRFRQETVIERLVALYQGLASDRGQQR